MWWRKKQPDPELLAAVKALTLAVEEQKGSGNQTLARAIETFATKAIENQGANLKAIADVTASLSDLMVKKAASALGSRGGRKTQEKKRTIKTMQDCMVCLGMRASSPEIVKHVQEGHEAIAAQAARAVAQASRANGSTTES